MGRKALYGCVSFLSISVGLVYIFTYVDLGHVQKTVKNAVSSISHMRIVFDSDETSKKVHTSGSLKFQEGILNTSESERSRPSTLLATLSIVIKPESTPAVSSMSIKTSLSTSIMDLFGITKYASSQPDGARNGDTTSETNHPTTSVTTAESDQTTIKGVAQKVKASHVSYRYNILSRKHHASKGEIEKAMAENINLFTWPRAFGGPPCVRAKLKMLPFPEPFICTFNLYEDKVISKSLQENGTWENSIMMEFKLILIKIKDMNLIDLGANLGVYTLAAARLGRHVIAVEPCYRSVNNLHRSVVANQYESKIKLFVNAIANEKGLYRMKHQPGFILNATVEKVPSDEIYSEDLQSKKIVPSITMNELIPYADFKKAILKIDISGSERDVFTNADDFFTHFDIPYIFMHWGNVQHLLNAGDIVSYLVRRDYRPKQSLFGNTLSLNDFNAWNGSVIWIKSSMINTSLI